MMGELYHTGGRVGWGILTQLFALDSHSSFVKAAYLRKRCVVVFGSGTNHMPFAHTLRAKPRLRHHLDLWYQLMKWL